LKPIPSSSRPAPRHAAGPPTRGPLRWAALGLLCLGVGVAVPCVAASGSPAAADQPASPTAAAPPASPTTAAAEAAWWPSFRGPGASGVAPGPAPAEWNAETGEGIAWKTAIPGLSHASPVVWGDRIFVATAVSSEASPETRFGLYGDVAPVESRPEHSYRLLALDRHSGKVLWDREAAKVTPRVKRHPKSTHSDPTPATDGKRVVALFPAAGLFAFDLDGKLLWQVDLGTLDAGWFYDPTYQWEFGSSPVLWNDLVFVQADVHSGSFLAAFDAATGQQRWRVSRDEIPSWATPTVVERDGRAELITNATGAIRAYDPQTGKELWQLRGNSEIVVPTPFAAHGLVYLTSGYAPIQPIYAVRAGLSGDVTPAEGQTSNAGVAWSHRNGGPYMPTPVVVGEHLFTVGNNGIVAIYDAKSGERLAREKLPVGAAFTASPVAADGKVFLASEDGDVWVLAAGPKFELLGKNPVGEVMMATPAIVDGVLYVRGRSHLFAVKGAGATTAPEAAAAVTTPAAPTS
jgi:outer membrane protein assembly factor BamB